MKKILKFLAKKSDRVCFMLTKKSVKGAEQFIPTNLEREKKIYLRFVQHRSNEESIFQSHEWSPELRSWLIEEGGPVLHNLDMISNKEVVALLKSEYHLKNEPLIEAALKRVTLKKEDILKIDVKKIYSFIQRHPKCFVNMSISQAYGNDVLFLILDEIEKSSCNAAQAFSKLEELLTLDPDYSSGTFSRAALLFAGSIANPERLMETLSKKCYSAYKFVAENLGAKSEIVQNDLILDALNSFMEYPNEGEKVDLATRLGDKYDKRQISLFWLYKAMKKTNSERVMSKLESIFFQNMRLEKNVKNDLIEALLSSHYSTKRFLMSIPGELQVKSKLLKSSSRELCNFIPFKNWDETDWKEAISFLIKNGDLRYDQLSLLNGDKKEYAKSELKLKAQILLLRGDDYNAIETLLSNLPQRVEIWQVIVEQYATCCNHKKRLFDSLMTSHEIPAEQFRDLITKLSEEDVINIIRQKELSEKELLVLRISRFNYLTANI